MIKWSCEILSQNKVHFMNISQEKVALLNFSTNGQFLGLQTFFTNMKTTSEYKSQNIFLYCILCENKNIKDLTKLLKNNICKSSLCN